MSLQRLSLPVGDDTTVCNNEVTIKNYVDYDMGNDGQK